ncbi:acyl-CoA N-acyltransferase [Aspergillus germanicus]
MSSTSTTPSAQPQVMKATLADIERIESMIRAAFTKYIERIGKPPSPLLLNYNEIIQTHEVYVLQDKSTIQGSIILEAVDESNTLEVGSLVVDPAAQGRGYGRILMEFAEERARAQARRALTLYTNVKMWENLGLYRKLGFVEVGRRVQDGYERVFFEKDISNS